MFGNNLTIVGKYGYYPDIGVLRRFDLCIPDAPTTRLEKLTAAAHDSLYLTPDQFAKVIQSDLEKWTRVIRTANIKVD